MSRHSIRIESPHGKYLLTKVFLDGQEMRGIVAAHVYIDYSKSHDVEVTLTLRPSDLTIDGEAAITMVSRLKALPPLLTDGQEEA